jgi:mannose-1-phosphate guanylyltransferase
MKAMILAAGKGTRVRPITHVLPKPMIPLVRKPVMEFLIEHLKSHGVREIVINTSHLANVIEHYFRDGERHGVQIAYSFEGKMVNGELQGAALGSAGGMRKIQDFSGFFDETFAVLCGDALLDVDLSEMLRFHREKKSIATVLLRDVPQEEVSKYGVVQTDSSGRITRFQEKPKREDAVSTRINTGVYLFEPEIFRYIPAGEEYDIGGQLLPRLARENAAIYGVDLPFTWVDIGSVPDYWEATRLLLSGAIRGFTMPGRQIQPGIYGGINLQLGKQGVQLAGPLFIGSTTSIGDGATVIGPSVIGSGCVIEPGATLRECILADYTRVSSAAVLERKLIFGNKCIEPSGQYIDIDEAQIGWIVNDARNRDELSESGRLLFEEVQALVEH